MKKKKNRLQNLDKTLDESENFHIYKVEKENIEVQ